MAGDRSVVLRPPKYFWLYEKEGKKYSEPFLSFEKGEAMREALLWGEEFTKVYDEIRKWERSRVFLTSCDWSYVASGLTEAIKNIREVQIELQEHAATSLLSEKDSYEYLESKFGVEMVVPTGRIEELDFRLEMKTSNKELYFLDGFPKELIEDKWIVHGKITLKLGELFQLIPTLTPLKNFPTGIIGIELDPIEFRLFRKKDVKIAFGGQRSSWMRWYIKGEVIKGGFGIVFTVRKPKDTEVVEADVKARWVYNPPGLLAGKVGSEPVESTVRIWPA